MHEDLKEEIRNNIKSIKEDNFAELVKKAKKLMELEQYSKAYDVYDEISVQHPEKSIGWIGKYEALTHNYTYFENYASFVCGGYYLDGDDDSAFLGYSDIASAMQCEDCDKEKLTTQLSGFIKKCCDFAINDCQKRYNDELSNLNEQNDEYYGTLNYYFNFQKKHVFRSFIPSILIAVIFGLLSFIWTVNDNGIFFTLLPIAIAIIILKKVLPNNISNAQICKETIAKHINELKEKIDIDALEKSIQDCEKFNNDIMNAYSIVMNDLNTPEVFVKNT